MTGEALGASIAAGDYGTLQAASASAAAARAWIASWEPATARAIEAQDDMLTLADCLIDALAVTQAEGRLMAARAGERSKA